MEAFDVAAVMQQTRRHFLQDRIDAILHAYDAALKLPETKIPTPLHLAIENARPR